MDQKLKEKLDNVHYSGEDYTRSSLEDMVKTYQDKHQEKLNSLASLRDTHQRIAEELTEDLQESKSAWDHLKGLATGDLSQFKGLLQRMPIVGKTIVGDRPIRELLQEKIKVTESRVREVGSFLDSLEVEIENVRKDITRLNKKMVVAAQNEEQAASIILELNKTIELLREERESLGEEVTSEHRAIDAQISELEQMAALHGGKLRLYSNAEDRIFSIIRMNGNFLEMLTNLQTNMQSLYDTGQEVLDELHGNLSGLTTAAQASELAMNVQESMQSLKDSVNKVAVLASNTSLNLTQNVDKLTSEMKIYDEETQRIVEANLEEEREINKQRMEEILELAKKEKQLFDEAKTTDNEQ